MESLKPKSRAPMMAGIVGAVVITALGFVLLTPQTPNTETLAKLEGDMHSLLFIDNDRVLYGQHAGLQVSSDDGKTWTAPGGQGDAMGLGMVGDKIVYLAGHDVFQKSLDGAKTWTSPGFGNLPSTDIHGFSVAPTTGWLYANLAGKGLYRSTDGGKNWQLVSPTTGGAMVLVAGSGSLPTLFAATAKGIIRSTDGGVNWQALPSSSSLVGMALAVHPKSGTVYASSATGLMRSTDNGESWQTLNGPGEALALIATNPKNETQLMVVSGTGQVYSSRDGGQTWKGR